MKTNSLPTIVYVDFIQIEDISIYPHKNIAPGDTISIIGYFRKLKLSEPSSCNVTTEQTPNGLVYNTKISGVTFDDGNFSLQQLLQTKFHVYRITDVCKVTYLIGLNEKPFPEIIFSNVNDASPSGLRAINFEITWISTLPPIEIFDL